MNKLYIFESSKNVKFISNEAIIMLPDIYCQTDYSKKTVEDFASSFRKPVFILDYFYISTGEANNLDINGQEKARELMANFDPQKFVSFFEKSLEEIESKYSNINKFSVVGFCFGGRLAYIAGGSEKVFQVISFYGGGANTPNYIEGKTPVEYLISKKNGNISVTSLFGTNDPSIPEEDRKKIKKAFTRVGIKFSLYEYDAGHAYFQEGRKNYNEVASRASWEVLRQILND